MTPREGWSSAPLERGAIARFDGRARRFVMWQQGQVFKLKAKGATGQPLWAYRYRLEGHRRVGEAAGRRIRDSR